MDPNPSKQKCIFLFLILLIVLLVSCEKKKGGTLSRFPDRELVFETYEENNPSIGFINADGSGKEIIPIKKYAHQPTWSENGQMIFFVQPNGAYGQVSSNMNMGELYIYNMGEKIYSCGNEYVWSPVYSFDSEKYAYIKTRNTISSINLRTCKLDQTYIKDEDNPIEGYSYFENYIIYGIRLLDEDQKFSYQIFLLNSDTGARQKIDEGINPNFSPDGQQIAYLKYDGIYILNINTLETKRIVWIDLKDSNFEQYIQNAPTPQWSPDGKWLIYHRCQRSGNCDMVDDFSIYKVSLDQGEEIKITDYGLYADWK